MSRLFTDVVNEIGEKLNRIDLSTDKVTPATVATSSKSPYQNVGVPGRGLSELSVINFQI